MRTTLKSLAERIPYGIGRFTAHVPFSWRLGGDYRRFGRLINDLENASFTERHDYLIARLNAVVSYAQTRIPFYRTLYGRTPIRIRTLDDFEALPVITKADVRTYTMNTRGDLLVNTGGSTGEPLSFYLDKRAWAREWAHMHHIWAMKGYRQTDLIATMMGKNLGAKLHAYNAVHNEIRINPYTYSHEVADEILALFEAFPIRFVQGYPSSLYNLFRELERGLPESGLALIRSKVRGCFLSSEYPMPYMVAYLRDVWGLSYISWYGHSEMCILAHDQHSEGKYRPFITYGYAEEVAGQLCGTSFHNYSMPLIRYATGDTVKGERTTSPILDYFVIEDGREGDFVTDKAGRKIPLTSMVFGRHHAVFNIADYVQVLQCASGTVSFYITFKDKRPRSHAADLRRHFDLRDLDMDFSFVSLMEPVRTKAGKLKLKLTQQDIASVSSKSTDADADHAAF